MKIPTQYVYRQKEIASDKEMAKTAESRTSWLYVRSML